MTDWAKWIEVISEHRAQRKRDGLPVWEDVESEPSPDKHTYLQSFAVPGGWLYRCYMEGSEETAAMVFVPDPNAAKPG